MYEQDEEYMDEGEDGDEISNEIWQEVGLCVFIQQVFYIRISGLLDCDLLLLRGEGPCTPAARLLRRVYPDECAGKVIK